jgi:photosystem II stability/assembly factor-like uncharacterized protein
MDATEALSPRARRAMPLIAGALATIVVASLLYLHPRFLELPRLPVPTSSPGPSVVSPRYLNVYDFVTPSIGWAVLEDSATGTPSFWVFKTTDAAKHWQREYTGTAGSTNAGPLTLQFFDPNNGLLALGGADSVYRTHDGGAHWMALAMPVLSFSSLFFSDPLHGWILGYLESPDRTVTAHFFSTSDGGSDWVVLPQPPAWQFAGKGGGLGEFAFRFPGEGWMGGATPDQATVYSSDDGGLTWQGHPLPVPSSKGGVLDGIGQPLIEASVSLIPGAGVLAVAFGLDGTPVGLTSFDGGSTWRRLAPAPGETSYGDFVFQDTFHWWATRYGTLWKSTDAGQTWRQVAQQVDRWDYHPHVIDATHAWAELSTATPPGQDLPGAGLAMTADAGLHWKQVNAPQPG